MSSEVTKTLRHRINVSRGMGGKYSLIHPASWGGRLGLLMKGSYWVVFVAFIIFTGFLVAGMFREDSQLKAMREMSDNQAKAIVDAYKSSSREIIDAIQTSDNATNESISRLVESINQLVIQNKELMTRLENVSIPNQ